MEDAPAWVAVGIGINVRNPIPAALSPTAVALAEELPRALRPTRFSRSSCPACGRSTPAALDLDEVELSRLAARDWLRGRRRLPPGGRVGGRHRAETGVCASSAMTSDDHSGCGQDPSSWPSPPTRRNFEPCSSPSTSATPRSPPASSRPTRCRRTGGSPPIPIAHRTSGAARSARSSFRPDIRPTRSRRCASRRWRRR